MASFNTSSIDLSFISPETGLHQTANVYTLKGVTNEDGSLRTMSIGQLVMAICLQRAAKLEEDIVELMREMADNTNRLEALSLIEAKIVAKADDPASISGMFGEMGFTQKDIDNLNNILGTDATLETYYDNYLADYLDLSLSSRAGSRTATIREQDISEIESKMDSLNTFSQEKLIELQSTTNKRDQTYDLASNVQKSLNNILIGNANNL